MSESNQGQGQDRDAALSKLYQKTPKLKPPLALDREIRAHARQAVKRSVSGSWWGWMSVPRLATAFSVLLGAAVLLQVLRLEPLSSPESSMSEAEVVPESRFHTEADSAGFNAATKPAVASPRMDTAPLANPAPSVAGSLSQSAPAELAAPVREDAPVPAASMAFERSARPLAKKSPPVFSGTDSAGYLQHCLPDASYKRLSDQALRRLIADLSRAGSYSQAACLQQFLQARSTGAGGLAPEYREKGR